MKISVFTESIAFRQPLSIAGRTLASQSVVRVSIKHGHRTAQAEAAGVFYRGETGFSMMSDVQAAALDFPEDLTAARQRVNQMLPGGARNAMDWALWQLVAAERGEPTYWLARLPKVQPLVTMVTLGVAEPAAMAEAAAAYPAMKALKLKLDGTEADADRVAAVRAMRPDARLHVDANEGWTPAHLDRMLGTLVTHRVDLIEQPLAARHDSALEGFRSPIPLAADESLQTADDLDCVARRYQVANIKLDKCGGLTSALSLAAEARRRQLRVMVGCMGGAPWPSCPHSLQRRAPISLIWMRRC